NKGGEARSWVLKKYDDDHHRPLELINPVAAPQFGYPLSLFTYDEALRGRLRDALFAVDAQLNGPNKTVSFEYSDGELEASKRFTFIDESYEIGIETEVHLRGAMVPAFPVWPSGFGDQTVAS